MLVRAERDADRVIVVTGSGRFERRFSIDGGYWEYLKRQNEFFRVSEILGFDFDEALTRLSTHDQ